MNHWLAASTGGYQIIPREESEVGNFSEQSHGRADSDIRELEHETFLSHGQQPEGSCFPI